jgi:hypothetical protein
MPADGRWELTQRLKDVPSPMALEQLNSFIIPAGDIYIPRNNAPGFIPRKHSHCSEVANLNSRQKAAGVEGWCIARLRAHS